MLTGLVWCFQESREVDSMNLPAGFQFLVSACGFLPSPQEEERRKLHPTVQAVLFGKCNCITDMS